MSYINTSDMSVFDYFCLTTMTHPFTCQHCSFAFTTQKDLNEHCTTTHPIPGYEIRVIIKKNQKSDLYVSEVCHQIKPIGIN